MSRFSWLVRTLSEIVLTSLTLAAAGAAAPSGTYLDWAAQAWGQDHTNSALAAPWADPDGDGIPNFLEYALGLDPTRPDADRAPKWTWATTAAGREFQLRFQAPLSAREADLRVRWSRDLAASIWLDPDGQMLFDNPFDTNAVAVSHASSFRVVAAEPRAFANLAAIPVPFRGPPRGWVWFEAEPPGSDIHTNLSGGQMNWLDPTGVIEKTVTIPADGTYTFWARKFWNPQTFRWRVGTADSWKTANNPPLADYVELRPGDYIGWMNLGDVALSAGATTLRLEGTDSTNITAYDCFLLTREPFTPRGKLKPDDSFTSPETGWFAFQPEHDPFDLSPIDLRRLNEREAGDGGFIAVRNGQFVHSKTGESVRFWAVNAIDDMPRRAKGEVDYFARTMAKRGVNLVRLLIPVYETSGPNFGRIDTNLVTQIQYAITALKRQGVYTALDLYFPLFVQLGPQNTDFPGYTGQSPFVLLFYDAAFQQLYRSWWEYVLTTPNPFSGLALRDDPALALIELVNEDSFLWWSFDPTDGNTGNIPDPQRAVLEKRFADWLLQKHPGNTLAQIRDSFWNGLTTPQDDFAAGRVGFRPLWNIANERTPRDQDTAQFLTLVQTEFFQTTYAYVKAGLRYRGLISASNWATGSPQYLGPLEKWSNSFCDYMDRHGYFDGYHTGEQSDSQIRTGHKYDDRAALKFQPDQGAGQDFSNPLFDIKYNGQPSTLSEVGWTPPNRLRADFPVLAAAYGSLQGSDGIYFFAASSPAWEGTLGKFSLETPTVFGQFPATALIYRQGLVRTAPRVVEVQLMVSNLFALQGTPMPAPQNFDQLRGSQIPPGGTLTNVSAIDELAFLVGGVNVDFLTNGQPQSAITDLSPYINRTNKIARSQTGELEWNWALGIVKIGAPAAQGVTGFLGGAGTVDLPGVTIQSTNEYGSILLVSLDRQPIATSSQLLLQVATEEKPLGWTTDATSGQRTIRSTGVPPLLVRNFSGSVTLKRADATSLRITPLDANGYRLGSSSPYQTAITLQPDQMYYLLER